MWKTRHRRRKPEITPGGSLDKGATAPGREAGLGSAVTLAGAILVATGEAVERVFAERGLEGAGEAACLAHHSRTWAGAWARRGSDPAAQDLMDRTEREILDVASYVGDALFVQAGREEFLGNEALDWCDTLKEVTTLLVDARQVRLWGEEGLGYLVVSLCRAARRLRSMGAGVEHGLFVLCATRPEGRADAAWFVRAEANLGRVGTDATQRG